MCSSTQTPASFLALNLVQVTSLNRDASGNVVIAIHFNDIALDLDYNSAGQLTGATVFGMPFPININML